MISINLIPDVKLEMLRAQRVRNITVTVAILVGLLSIAVVVVLGGIIGAQTIAQAAAEKKIDSQYRTLVDDNEQLNETLTIQQQLGYISGLNDGRTKDSRLLDLVQAINPSAPDDMKFSKITIDPIESTMTLEGSAVGGYASAEVFRKTILHTMIEGKERGSDENIKIPLTDDVQMKDMRYGENSDGEKVLAFKVVFVYPDDLFNNMLTAVKVVTPESRIDVTDSKTRVPDSMFSQAPKKSDEGGAQ